MSGRLARALPHKHFAPPLQPDFTRHRLARQLADARHFGVKGIQREKRIAQPCRRKQRREIAVPVDLPHEPSTMFEMALHQTQSSAGHATAISPAPTRRFSASMMLYVRTAAPVGMLSTESDKSRNRLLRRSGNTHGSRPAPIRKKSRAPARSKAASSADADSSAALLTGQAQIPSGKHSNEPRCDMPPKRKPPSP